MHQRRLRTDHGQQTLHTIAIRMPIVGKLTQSFVTARIVRLLGTLMNSHLPLLQVLELVKGSAGNRHYAALIAERFKQQWFFPFVNPIFLLLETLPLMLMGMGLYRQGFFSGGYNPAKMQLWGWTGVIVGGGLSLAIGLFIQAEGFSLVGVNSAFIGWSIAPRLMMVLGMAALLVEYSKTATGWLAERISAAGRAAFTNYLGTSIVMMIVFQGWGLGLFGELNRPMLYLVTFLTWALMLTWSKPWLERYRYGPLEWVWRCLTYRQVFQLRR